jgi:rhamnogalacturonan endolyase
VQDAQTFQKAAIADLDGDGAYDFVLKSPNENIDPYEKYWKPSPDTYQLDAYRGDGQFLWSYDLGWAIERGIWYSPYVVYDLDGDGCAEVAVKTGKGDPRDADGRVQTGPEFVTILDGATGQPRTQTAWIDRDLFEDGSGRGYNYASRNQMAVAYLDGKHPSLLVERGTYRRMILVAYDLRDGQLHERWRWDNKDLSRDYWGQGAHWMHAADVDGDGRQEVVMGSCVIDDDGRELWTTGLGHPDHAYVGDIDPARPGLEIYYGIESRRQDANGMCLVAAESGKILWGYQGFTRHVHSFGMCSDIDADHPGSESYSADTDEEKKALWARLWSARGDVIDDRLQWGFGPRTVYWDADPQRELLQKRITDYGSEESQQDISGRVVTVADVLGDWREEILVTSPGELRIYATTIPASDRRICLMQDPLYRMDVVVAGMGYYQVPMLSYDMASQRSSD